MNRYSSFRPSLIFVCLIILIATLIFYLPYLIKPSLLLNRGNDLQEVFWPIFYFIKQSVINHQQIALWNNLFSSGMPLLPDPQFSLLYLPNLLFIILPTDFAFIISFTLHTFVGGLMTYVVAKQALKFSSFVSLTVAIFYILSPRVAGFLEAGHFGLAISSAWFPILLLAEIRLITKPSLIWSVLLAVSLSAFFFIHSVAFVLSLFFAVLLIMTSPTFIKIKPLKSIWFLIVGIIITFGSIAITLLPQVEWIPQTNRFLLLQEPDVYPKWRSIKEFIQIIILPWKLGVDDLRSLDTEKYLTFGIIPLVFALIGFLTLRLRLKIIIILLIVAVLTIALNNASPLSSFLLTQKWFALMRVSTRVWFVPILLVTFLAGRGVERLLKSKITVLRLATYFCLTAAIVEITLLSWLRLTKPFPDSSRFASGKVYDFLSQDKSLYRVFCITRCLSQKKSAQHNLELTEGYNTLQQKNYYQQSWQLMGGYWNYYSLAIPPIGTKLDKLKPDPRSLGFYNVKYVISPYELTITGLKLAEKFDEFYIYKNDYFKERAYFLENQEFIENAPIVKYTPNNILVQTPPNHSSQLVLSQVFSTGWKAYLNGIKKIDIQQTPEALSQINLTPQTKYVDFKYEPDSFNHGRMITLATLVVVVGFLLFKN